MQHVTFPTDDRRILAGDVYLPEGSDENGSYPAIAVAHPGGAVKEQAAGLYASRLAERGFIALAFDASYQGESGGEPRFMEDPYARVEDVRAAVDYLQSLDHVDAERIGALGMCAGGGYAVNATMTDHRIKALTTVSMFNTGSSFRRGWFGLDPDSAFVATLEQAAKQRTAEAQGAETFLAPYVPTEVDEIAIRDLRDAHEYYLTERAQHPNAQNKFVFARSASKIAGFDAFHLVEDLLTQPLLIVAGSEASTLWYSTELYSRARSNKKLFLVQGSAHMDLYDVPEYMNKAIAEIASFFTEHLVG